MRAGRADLRVQAGLRFEAEGQLQRAEREYRAALEIMPRHVVALNNLGLLYAARGRFAEAAPLFRRATFADPSDLVSQVNHAGVLRELGDEGGALDGFSKALAADPASRVARLNLANLLRSQGRLDEARPHYQQLLARNPGDGEARWNLAALEGLAGDLNAAFSGFALQHRLAPSAPPPPLRRWGGEPLSGRRILLDADQGLGDTIMFCRFARRVAELGGKAILRAQPELERLLARVDGVASFARRDGPVPEADVWFPLVDLPALPGVGTEAEPGASPYISPPVERSAAWSERLPRKASISVGLVWAGNPTHPDDRNRSLPLRTLLDPLSAIDGVELVSLQKGPRGAEADGTGLTRADRWLGDFADTAAALARLDLVISVDTAVLHLAGAMGRPTWALIAFAPDWRWMLERADSPWYPSVRLYRQLRSRDWTGAIDQVAHDLGELARR